MTRAEIDALEQAWMEKLLSAVGEAIRPQVAAMAARGHGTEDINAALLTPELAAWLAERRKDIRALIISGRYAIEPTLAFPARDT
jgi:hypothetical protein